MAQYLLYDQNGYHLTDGTRRVALGVGPGAIDRLDLQTVQTIGGQTFFKASGSDALYTIDRYSAEIRLVDDRATFENGIADYWQPGDVAALGSGFILSGAFADTATDSLYRYSLATGLTLLADDLRLNLSSDMVSFGGKVFFAGGEAGSLVRSELFVTNGTAAGTGLFNDFFPLATNLQGEVDLDARWIVGDRMVMTAAYATYGGPVRGLFATDATPGSTVQLPIALMSKHLTDIVPFGDRLYVTNVGIDNNHALWMTDGTVGGSRRVADEAALIALSPYAGLPYTVLVGGRYQSGGGIVIDEISTPFEVGGKLYVMADATKYFAEQRTLFFEVDGGTARYVGQNIEDGFWRTDIDRGVTTGLGGILLEGDGASGIQPALYLVDPATAGADPEKLMTFGVLERLQQTFDLGDRLILVTFQGGSSTSSRRILSTDGTTAGTFEIDARSIKSYLKQVGDQLYWVENEDLWVTDGTLAGTRMLIEGTFQAGDPLPIGMIELDPLAFQTLGTSLRGTSAAETVTGTSAAEPLFGLGGSDRVRGSAGDDSLFGGSGNDSLYGGDGADQLHGGTGADRMEGGDGFDTADHARATDGLRVDLSFATGNTGEARGDTYLSVEGVRGGDGNDRLSGNSRDNRLDGGIGNDTLDGRAGNDTLSGGTGNDLLTGGSGNDLIYGGAGADRFVFAPGAGSDRIYFFQNGTDRVVISSGAADFAALSVTDSGENTVIRFADTRITLVGTDAAVIGAEDFLFG